MGSKITVMTMTDRWRKKERGLEKVRRYSCQKTKSRLHIPISTVVHAEVVCAPTILPIGIFLHHILRSMIIALWDMSQYQNSPRISLETSVFYLNFRVRFFLVLLWRSKLDTAAEETCTRLIFSLPRVVRSSNVQYLPYSHRDTLPWSIKRKY